MYSGGKGGAGQPNFRTGKFEASETGLVDKKIKHTFSRPIALDFQGQAQKSTV